MKNSDWVRKVQNSLVDPKTYWYTLILIPTIFAFQFCRSLFYVTGAYWQDMGWMSYSLCASFGAQPPGTSEFWGQKSVYGVHTFITQTLLCRTFDATINNPRIAMCLLLALGVFLTGVLGILLAGVYLDSKRAQGLFGLFLALSPFAMGSISYPHPEGIAAAISGLGIAVYMRRNELLGSILIFFGILGREDIGIHIFIASAVFLIILRDELTSNLLKNKLRRLGQASLAMSISLFLVQHYLFPTTVSVVNAGYPLKPPFGPLFEANEMLKRATVWLSTNPGILGFGFSLLALFWVTRSKIFLVPLVSSVPWIFINMLSPDPSKATLSLYGSFPLLIYTAFLAADRQIRTTLSNKNQKREVSNLLLAGIVWLGLFGTFGNTPVGSYNSFERAANSWDQINVSQKYIEGAIPVLQGILGGKPNITIDPAVGSLLPEFGTRMSNSVPMEQGNFNFFYMPTYALGQSFVQAVKTNLNPPFSYCSDLGNLAYLGFTPLTKYEIRALGMSDCRSN
jgi:hypothetical protein